MHMPNAFQNRMTGSLERFFSTSWQMVCGGAAVRTRRSTAALVYHHHCSANNVWLGAAGNMCTVCAPAGGGSSPRGHNNSPAAAPPPPATSWPRRPTRAGPPSARLASGHQSVAAAPASIDRKQLQAMADDASPLVGAARGREEYYKTPTLRESPTSRIRGLNLKGPRPRPRGRGKWRPLGKKTQPTATASTGGKKVISGRNAQKYQKCFRRQTPV